MRTTINGICSPAVDLLVNVKIDMYAFSRTLPSGQRVKLGISRCLQGGVYYMY